MTESDAIPDPLVGDEAEHALDQAEARVGENVRALRQRQRLSQADLARRMGYSRTTVGNVELAERRITLGDLWALCRGLGVSLAELLEGTGAEEDMRLGTPTKAAPTASMVTSGTVTRTEPDFMLQSQRNDLIHWVEIKLAEQRHELQQVLTQEVEAVRRLMETENEHRLLVRGQEADGGEEP